jgi:hypothetical protein
MTQIQNFKKHYLSEANIIHAILRDNKCYKVYSWENKLHLPRTKGLLKSLI